MARALSSALRLRATSRSVAGSVRQNPEVSITAACPPLNFVTEPADVRRSKRPPQVLMFSCLWRINLRPSLPQRNSAPPYTSNPTSAGESPRPTLMKDPSTLFLHPDIYRQPRRGRRSRRTETHRLVRCGKCEYPLLGFPRLRTRNLDLRSSGHVRGASGQEGAGMNAEAGSRVTDCRRRRSSPSYPGARRPTPRCSRRLT